MDARQLDLLELTTSISAYQNLLRFFLPRSHPARVICLQGLAITQFERYMILKDSDDLEQSILHFTEAIFLPNPWHRPLNAILIFLYIAHALVLRADKFRQPEDVTRSIIYLRYLGRLPEVFEDPHRVKYFRALLVDALVIKAAIGLGHVGQDIEEMAVLCHGLLKSDLSTTSVSGYIRNLATVLKHQRGRLNELQGPSNKVIECLREASILLPDSQDVSVAFAWSLFDRFRISHSNDDYEEATTILEKVARIPGDKLTQNQEEALMLGTLFALFRLAMSRRPECLEQAILRTRTSLAELPPGHPFRSYARYILDLIQRDRFDGSGAENGFEEVHLNLSGVPDYPSFQDLTASLTELNADSEGKHLEALIFMDGITDKTEVEEAVKYCRLLLASSRPGSDLANLAGIIFTRLLRRALFCTKKIEYLNEAISVLRDSFDTRGAVEARFYAVQELISSLAIRFILLLRREDFDELMQLLPMAINDECASAVDRFRISCVWPRIAHLTGHTSTSAAYECAMSLMQDTLTFSPTLDIQHSRLVAMRDVYEDLTLDHTSFRVSIGQLPRAIETLEQGRALIWSELRGLRTSIDQIRMKDPHLADKFAAVNRDLELLTLTIPANVNDDDRDGGTVKMDPFGRLVVQQRKLLDDRNKLISQIQALPGFETFLKPSSFDNLRSAAARGPVIIINHSRRRSDIIILHRAFPPSLISTADDFYDRAINLQGQLFGARKEGLDSNEYEDALCFVLKELYELVGRPVIQRLNEFRVPKQSRVWWCPTSVFCSLPLHAMGPIPQGDGRPRYFLDLYIPSYTTTLSTLIESTNTGSDTLEMPSILLVSPPDASLPGASREVRVVQAKSFQVTTLSSETATPTTVLQHLRDHRFIHIVSHGKLEQGKPFDASFKLYGNKRLSLLDIVRSRLPEADFAFLSACHTAELTEDSIADEGIHLAAAMQYCGFRSVVGTMWELLDIDGQDIAKNFYKGVFSGRKQVVRYYERTAEALRDAVIHLREKKQRRETPMTLERWVNFVHYGA